jgi:hypothetical protein
VAKPIGKPERARLRPQNHRSVHCGGKALLAYLSQLNAAIEAAKPSLIIAAMAKR